MNVNSIADDFCHNMLMIKHCPYHAWLPVCKLRHCIVQVNRMIGSGRKCSRRSFIICIGMCKGNIDPVFYFLDKFDCVAALFRGQSGKFHKPIGCFQEPVADFYAAGKDIFFVLSAFFHMTDERSFHIDANQICLSTIVCFFLIFRGNFKDMFQFF